MATAYKLVLSFLDANGKTINFKYNYSKDSHEKSMITNVMNALITNGSIFKNVPVSKKSAYVLATEQTDYNIES